MAGGGLVMMLVFMLVLVSVAGRHRAALAVHPAGITASIMFFLPDRHAMFHFVDDEPAGVQALAPLRGPHPEFLERFVFQASDFLALVVIPNPPLEADIAACAQVEELAPRLGGIDGRLGKAKAHHPPATGGMNTTASPAASRRDQSLNSLLTATFNCSRVSVNRYRVASSPYRSAGVADEVSRVSSERPACSRISA